MMNKGNEINDMTNYQLAQRLVELEWYDVNDLMRAKLVDETVVKLHNGYITRDEVKAMIKEME